MKNVSRFVSVMLISIAVCGCSKGDAVKNEQVKASLDSTIVEEFDVEEVELDSLEIRKRIETITQAIANGDAKTLAHLTTYPIERPYPLKDIEDSAQMVAYFDTMFDAPIREKLRKATAKDWEAVGWRGYMFDDGNLWFQNELAVVNYVSKKEQQMIQALKEKEQATLHGSLRGNGWEPVSCYLGDDGTLFRLDRKTKKKDDEYRLAIFHKGAKAGDKPEMILTGELEIMGSAAEHIYTFQNDKDVSVSFFDSAEEEELVMNMEINGKEKSVPVVPCWWLDIIK